VIGAVLAKLDLGEQLWLRRLESEWVEVAGQTLARHARPGRYERRILVVFVDSSSWLSELNRYGRKELLENLQKRFGADRISDLRLQLDPG
jgi:predicted nucleic acid-binding Zn ribbon protein